MACITPWPHAEPLSTSASKPTWKVWRKGEDHRQMTYIDRGSQSPEPFIRSLIANGQINRAGTYFVSNGELAYWFEVADEGLHIVE